MLCRCFGASVCANLTGEFPLSGRLRSGLPFRRGLVALFLRLRGSVRFLWPLRPLWRHRLRMRACASLPRPYDRQRAVSGDMRLAGVWSTRDLPAGTWLFVPLSSDPRQYVESAFNTGTSLLAALLVVIRPIGVIRDQQRMERLLLQQGTGDVRCTVLAESERLLLHAADSQESARNALAHIGNVAVNVGLGLVLGYGLDRPQGAAVNTSVGIVLGELMIATRPRQALRSLERYRIGNLQPESETLTMPLSVTPLLMRSGYGVAVSSNF